MIDSPGAATRRGVPLPASPDSTALPPGYVMRRVGEAELVATESTIDALSDAITAHDNLYAWARQVKQPRALSGRAPVFVAEISGHDPLSVVVRHAWHGGLLAPLTRDVYRRPSRAPRELHISHALRVAGIRTPEIVAYALYDVAPGFVRVDVASRYIEHSYDLAAVLADHAPEINRDESFRALNELMTQLAHHSFVHPDLNVKNVLLYREPQGVVAAVLDVDVMEQLKNQDMRAAHQQNRARLERSLRKAPLQFGIQISESEYANFDASMQRIGGGLS